MALVEMDTGAAFAAILRSNSSFDGLGLAYAEKQIATFHRWIQTLDPEFETSVIHCLMMAACAFFCQRLPLNCGYPPHRQVDNAATLILERVLRMSAGTKLVEACKEHVLATMKGMPECEARSGPGAGYRVIEQNADFDLDLGGQNGWLTWSLLIALSQDGKVEVVPGTEKRRKYRLR